MEDQKVEPQIDDYYRFFLFRPHIRLKGDYSILAEYPDLKKEYPQIEGLHKNDQLFIALMAQSKGLDNDQEDIEKVTAAYQVAFGGTLYDHRLKEFQKGNIPPAIKTAIKKIRGFSLTHRVRGKMIAEAVFNNLESFLRRDMTQETDVAEMKKYADLAKDLPATLTELINRIETGWGVSMEEKKKENKGNLADAIQDLR